MAFAEAGAHVVVAGRRAETIDPVVAGIQQAGHEALAVELDIADVPAVQRMVDTALERYGQIDVLVNNAGAVVFRGPALDNTEESWDRVMDVNLKSVFVCSKAVLPHMIERGSGSIVNVGSIAAHTGGGIAVGVDYGVAKAGVHTLTRRLAREVAEHGVRVNAVAPHGIETAMHAGHPAELLPAIRGMIPMGRFGQSEEMAGPILFLASEHAGFITGQVLHVNGGALLTG